MSGLRRLRPSLGNGRLPDFHCKSVTIAPLAPYVPKAKTASECGEVPRNSDHSIAYGAGDVVGNEQRAPSAIRARQITDGLAVEFILDAIGRIR
jgi:hypothetical protein